MKVSAIQKSNKLSFCRRLTADEMNEYKSTMSSAKNLVGQSGKSILLVHDVCLPQTSDINTGVGNITNRTSGEFFDFAHNYLGINTIQILPQGEIPKRYGNFIPYCGSAFSLGNQVIAPELLCEKKFENILSKEEFNQIVENNKIFQTDGLANCENVMTKDSFEDKILYKAFERFEKLDKNTQLKKDFNSFIKENNEWLEPKSVYNVLKKKNNNANYTEWVSEDKNLYLLDKNVRNEKIAEILKENEKNTEFYKFKQFIAEEHLKLGKENINKKGMKLIGDCLVGFSKDEIWANRKAFKDGYQIGWGLPALNFDEINDEKSEASKFLKRKVQLFAKRYDSIRFDVGWSYVTPLITNWSGDKSVQKKEMGDSVLKFIEKSVKEVKGKDFDSKDLIWEFEADSKTFALFRNENNDGKWVVTRPAKERCKVFSSTYMNEASSATEGYGSNDAFLRRGWNSDEFVIGVGNHDQLPLRQIAERTLNNDENHLKSSASYALSKIFNVKQEIIENPVEFAKYKLAEPMSAKHNFVFYMDVFGKKEVFDSHDKASTTKYSYKIGENYLDDYMKSIKEGFGFNPMDALEKMFIKNELDKKQNKLFEKIVKFKNILLEPEKIVEKISHPEKNLKTVMQKTIEIGQKNVVQEIEYSTEISKSSIPKSLKIGLGVVAFVGSAIAGYKYSHKE